MGSYLKWFFIIAIIALLIEYWCIIIPILAIYLFISCKNKKANNHITSQQVVLPQIYDNMNGHEFEQYCADILRKTDLVMFMLRGVAEILELIYWLQGKVGNMLYNVRIIHPK